jgi:hypothetical protein
MRESRGSSSRSEPLPHFETDVCFREGSGRSRKAATRQNNTQAVTHVNTFFKATSSLLGGPPSEVDYCGHVGMVLNFPYFQYFLFVTASGAEGLAIVVLRQTLQREMPTTLFQPFLHIL